MQKLNEYANNNEIIINEEQFIIKNGVYLDSINKKMGIYTCNRLNNRINERDNNILLTLNEQNTAKGLLTFVLNEYYNSLTTELNALNEDIKYLSNFSGDYITEGILDKMSNYGKNIWNKAKEKYNSGKEAVIKAANNIKTKITLVGKILKKIAQNAIKSIKDIFNSLLEILEKVGGKVVTIFEKCGLKTEKLESVWNEGAQQLAKNPDEFVKKLKGDNVYEALGNEIKNGNYAILEKYNVYNNTILEDEETEESDGEVVKQGEKKGIASALWQAFLGFLRWFVVCVAIPGFVIGFFPGTFLALLVPLACKLAWNCYSIVKVWRQIKKVRKDWGSMKTWQKWLNVITIIATIIGICFNFKTLYDTAGPVLEGFAKSGFKLMSEAKLGIEPDMLQKGFGALVKMLREGKFSFDDLGQAYKEIGESFAKEVNITKAVKTVVKHGADMGKNMDEISKIVSSKDWKSSAECINWFKEQGIPLDKIPKDGVLKLIVDGHIDAKWGQQLLKFAAESGDAGAIKYAHHFNKILNGMNIHAGSVMELEMPAKLFQKMLSSGIDIGYKNAFSVISSAAEYSVDITNVVTTSLQILQTMAITVPSVLVDVQNDSGFRVRLGGKDSGKYVYEVGKDGVMDETYNKIEKGRYKALIEQNNQYKEQVEKDKNIDKDKKEKALKRCKEFDEKFNKKLNELKCIVLHGKLVDKGDEEEKNESYISLSDYLINEGYTNSDLKKSYESIYNYLLDRCKINAGKKDHWRKYFNGTEDTSNENVWKNALILFCNDYKKQGDTTKKDNDKTKDVGVNTKLDLTKDETLALLRACFELGKSLYKSSNNGELTDDDKKKLAEERKKNINTYKIILGYLNGDEKFIDDAGKKKVYVLPFKDKKNTPDDNTTQRIIKGTPVNPDDVPNNAQPADEPTEEPTSKPKDDNDSSDNNKDLTNDDGDKTPKKDDDNDSSDNDIILVFNPLGVNGFDVAKSDSKGPRKESYNFKGLYNSLEFIQIKGGLNSGQITELLGNILTNMVSRHVEVVVDKPCDEKYKLNETSGFAPDEERPDFGMLTNNEICDILNKKADFEKIFNSKGGEISAAETEDEKKELEQDQETAKEKISDDEELQDVIKKTNVLSSKYVKDGEINYDGLTKACAERRMAKKKKGIWAKIKSFLGFGKSNDYDKALDNLNSRIYESNDLLYDDTIVECQYNSLSNYIKKTNNIYAKKSLVDYLNK